MSKTLKNQTGVSIVLSDTGDSIPASPATFLIDPTRYSLYEASSDIITHIGSGDIIVNDGSNDLSKSEALDLLKDVNHRQVDTTTGGLIGTITDGTIQRLAVHVKQDATADHGDLAGLADDDHTQYLNETRHDALPADNPHSVSLEQARTVNNTLAGDINMGGNQIKDVASPVVGTDVANKDFVVSLINGLDWQDSVLDKDLTVPPGSPTTGDRYIVASVATGAWSGQEDKITEWNGTSWDFFLPNEGFATWIEDENVQYVFNGTSWVKFGSTVDHGNLLGLADDDHTQYLNETRHDALTNDNPHSVTFSQAVAADGGTNITAAEAETLSDGSNADALHTHIFGSEYHFAESEGEETTILGTYQQKLKLTTSVLPAGDYHIEWTAEIKTSDNDMLARCQVDDTTIINEVEHSEGPLEESGYPYYTVVSGFRKLTLTNAAHDIDIDYNDNGGGTAFIRRARITLWRVS